MRLSEILTLRWSYVDEERSCLNLPDSKTGAQSIQLNGPALRVFHAIPRSSGNAFVIAGQKEGAHPVNSEQPWRHFRALAELEDVPLHDLRYSFASLGAEGGIGLPLIGGLRGHTRASTTARYAHLAADPLKQADELIGYRSMP
ncbi:tyrosine-type recombinase/integrase [Methylobacterium sp. E-045]|uniref:tyrosine-type recombinase/integrase n=1 Tax=Methylobacterium sp. E-045 TaxID=2836575 RepID=UPI0039197A56